MGGGSSSQTVAYKYFLGAHLALCHGPVDAITRVKVDDTVVWEGNVTSNSEIYIDKEDAFGGESYEGGILGPIDVAFGEMDQATNPYLRSVLAGAPYNHPADFTVSVTTDIYTYKYPGALEDAPDPVTSDNNDYNYPVPAFRGVTCAILKRPYIGTNPYVKGWAFRVKRTKKTDLGATIWYSSKSQIGDYDMNPAHIVYECLTSQTWGMGYTAATIDDAQFRETADQLYDENFGLSFLWNEQDKIESFIQDVLGHINGILTLDRSTGLFQLRLVRQVEDTDSLMLLDENNISEVQSFTRPTTSERVSGVTVKYWNREEGDSASITYQDVAIANQQGYKNTTTVEYPGVCTDELAARLCSRELRTLSSPLLKCTLLTNREPAELNIGDAFKLSYGAYGLSNVVMRVVNIEFGGTDDNQLTLEAIQDVFVLAEAVYTPPPATSWTPPSAGAVPVDYSYAGSPPYYYVAQALGDEEAQAFDTSETPLVTLSSSPSSTTLGSRVLVNVNNTNYEDRGSSDFVTSAVVAEDVGPLDTQIKIKNANGINILYQDTGLMIGDEIVKVTTMDDAETMNIERGCLDTIPQEHSEGDLILGWQQGLWFDSERSYFINDTVKVKFQTRTPAGELAFDDAPVVTAEISDRMHLPYPPGQFRINNEYFPDYIVSYATVSWAHRDRLQQTAVLNDFYTGNIGPETGTVYDLEVLGETDNQLIKTEVDGTSYAYTDEEGIACSSAKGLIFGLVEDIEQQAVKSIVVDVHNAYPSTYGRVGIRQIDIYVDGTKLNLVAGTDFVGYESNWYGNYNLKAESAFDTTTSKTGWSGYTSWETSNGGANYGQRIICVLNTSITGVITKLVVENAHNSGGNTDCGAKDVTITASTDEITSTTYNDTITNSTVLFDGEIPEHVAQDIEDPFEISLSESNLFPNTARLNDSLTIKLNSRIGTTESMQKYNHTTSRKGYGYKFGESYGE